VQQTAGQWEVMTVARKHWTVWRFLDVKLAMDNGL